MINDNLLFEVKCSRYSWHSSPPPSLGLNIAKAKLKHTVYWLWMVPIFGGRGRGREELTCNEDGGLLSFMFQKGMLIREEGLRGQSRR